ncbi:MAG TPA: hypothetical protein VJ957_09725 [Longimicrobiales bacterium]|nr:hypothetical protein [Longimicrobiales bacterium]
MDENGRRDILRRLQSEAEERAHEAEGAERPFDLIDAARGEPTGPDAPAPDLTFRGYVETHDRVPAFEGSDSQPYTVDVDTEETGDPDRPWAAFLIFVRWAATGAGIMGHLESGDVAWGDTQDDARLAALDLTLFELKTELDAAIRRREEELES